MYKSSVIYVGVDVHKDTNSVCMYDPEDSSLFAEAKLDARTDNLCKYTFVDLFEIEHLILR